MFLNKNKQKEVSGVIGFFDEPTLLIEATKKVRDAKMGDFDVFTPYPIHGLEKAQGLKRSWIPYVTFGAGLAGFLTAFTVEYWTSAVSWPVIIGGKPFNSWPAFVPVMFELTVLLGGLCTVAAMFAANGLPNICKKAFDPGLTRDRFAIWISKDVPESKASEMLKAVGAKEVRTVFCEGWF